MRERRGPSLAVDCFGFGPRDPQFGLYEAAGPYMARQSPRRETTEAEAAEYCRQAYRRAIERIDETHAEWLERAVLIEPREKSGDPFDWSDEDDGVPMFRPQRAWD